MKKSLFLAVFLLTLLPAVTELGIGVCWAQSYMEEMMSWSMCFNDTRGYYMVFDNDCGNDKECRECLLCCDNWVIEDLYEEHLLMAHNIGGDPDEPNDPDPDPSSGNGDPDEPEGLGTSGGTGEGNTSATGYGEPDSGILLPQVNVNGHYEPPTPDFMLDNQNYSDDGIGYIGGGGGGSSQSQNNNSNDGKLTIQDILDLLSGKPGNLNKILKRLYDEGRIVIIDDLKKARYNEITHQLMLGPVFSLDQVVHELVHCLQDIKGQLSFDNNSVNNEFQAHLLEFIYMYTYPNGAGESEFFATDSEWWPDFFQSILSNVDVDIADPSRISIKKQLIDILNNETDYDSRTSKFSEFWKNKYKDSPEKEQPKAYWNSYNPEYEYNWEDYFKEYGFNIIN